MNWIQNLYETYEACAGAVGISGGEQDKMLLPIGHVLKKTNVAIHLRGNGTFHKAEKIDAEICTPCTDESESRTSGAVNSPHPLFDQIKHLTGKLYLNNLLKWQEYLKVTPEYPLAYKMISAVHKYLENGTLKNDLVSCKIVPDEKLFLRFCVSIGGQLEDRLWMIPEMWHAWHSYYKSENIEKRKTKDLCYISGKADMTYTEKHPKSINRTSGNAKLITGNDSSNFTYRGRFAKSSQAVTISYESSQKAHQALRWLIIKHGYRCDTQAIVAWAIDKVPELPNYYDDSYGIYESTKLTDSEKQTEAESVICTDYADTLKKTLPGYGGSDKLKTHVRRVAVAATDNATTGRMSVTYYRELAENEYLERIVEWHNSCKWYQPFMKDKDGKHKSGFFVGAPSFDRIVDAVLGKRRKPKDESYDKLKKSVRERLLHCVFNGERIPRDMINAAVHRASNPLALERTNEKVAVGRWRDWEQVLCAACALVKRYYHDYKKEEFEVALEDQRRDRDYLYGRLLAVADRIESAARYKQRSAEDARATNAIRYMTAFSQHPFRTWSMLFTQQLNPYIQQLNGAGWYLNQIEDIKALFNEGEYESGSALSGKYLLGFFAQRQKLRQKQEKNKSNNENGGVDNELDEQN
ncbi:MAG: type I-C CRISPR-associated protein Cas8c/Csd1 [Dethiobacter sp.]|nr:type I-C CRISPR-associated protein Cas8c/Csd1 [Dethiobacter sp.]